MGKIFSDDELKKITTEEYREYLLAGRRAYLNQEYKTVEEIKNIYKEVSFKLEGFISKFEKGSHIEKEWSRVRESIDKLVDGLNDDTFKSLYRGIRGIWQFKNQETKQILNIARMGAFIHGDYEGYVNGYTERALLSFMNRTYKDGLKVSDRVWRVGEDARRELYTAIRNGVAQGQDPRELAKSIKHLLNPDVATPLRSETRKKLGVSKDVPMEAMRLAVTELQNANYEATIGAYSLSPLYQGIYWRLSSNHPIEDICDEYASHNGDGFWEKGSEPTKPHPWCRCIAVPKLLSPEDTVKTMREWIKEPNSHPDIEKWYQENRGWFFKGDGKIPPSPPPSPNPVPPSPNPPRGGRGKKKEMTMEEILAERKNRTEREIERYKSILLSEREPLPEKTIKEIEDHVKKNKFYKAKSLREAEEYAKRLGLSFCFYEEDKLDLGVANEINMAFYQFGQKFDLKNYQALRGYLDKHRVAFMLSIRGNLKYRGYTAEDFFGERGLIKEAVKDLDSFFWRRFQDKLRELEHAKGTWAFYWGTGRVVGAGVEIRLRTLQYLEAEIMNASLTNDWVGNSHKMRHIYFHEIGHSLHYYLRDIIQDFFGDAEILNIYRELMSVYRGNMNELYALVSKYGMSTPNEMVAESIAGYFAWKLDDAPKPSETVIEIAQKLLQFIYKKKPEVFKGSSKEIEYLIKDIVKGGD